MLNDMEAAYGKVR